jgi:hypothetical protein
MRTGLHRTHENYRLTWQHGAVVVFMLMAVIAAQNSYIPAQAWNKLLVLAGASGLFGWITIKKRVSFLFVIGLSLASVWLRIADYLLMTKLDGMVLLPAVIDNYISARQAVVVLSDIDDRLGGLLGLSLPLAAGYLYLAISQKNRAGIIFGALSAVGFTIGMVVSGSRSAMFGMSAAALTSAVFLGLRPHFGMAASWFRKHRKAVVTLALSAFSLLVIAWVFRPDWVKSVLWAIPGFDGLNSRRWAFQRAFPLVSDFFVFGGGLAAFPGLLSRYVLGTTHLFLGYAHQLYIGILIEQGIFALLVFVGLHVSALYSLIRTPLQKYIWGPDGVMQLVLIGGTSAVLIHSLIDDALYGPGGSLLLFIYPALAIAFERKDRGLPSSEPVEVPKETKRFSKIVQGGGVILSVLLIFAFARPAASTVWSNMGAVQMAKAELREFPGSMPEANEIIGEYEVSTEMFIRSLEIWPNNCTAHYRLGLIEYQKGNYAASADHLEQAHRLSSEHMNIRKYYGFSLAWLGDIDRAAELLQPISDVTNELDTYSWYWGTVGEDDYSKNAALISNILK